MKLKNAPKTINNTYIQNISKSSMFIEKFMIYLKEYLLKDYIKQIENKFDGLMKKWEEEINANSDF